MSEVRKHQRRTASGKLTTVRRHIRDTDGAGGGDREAVDGDEAQPWRPPHVSALPPAGDAASDEAFWDDDPEPEGEWWDRDGAAPADPPALAGMKQEMRDWRALGEPDPPPMEPMNPGKAALLGCDTPEGMASFQRLRAYREAGYTGPLDRDNQIPDPDDPANQGWLQAGAALRGLS